jgi:hypothetical protein
LLPWTTQIDAWLAAAGLGPSEVIDLSDALSALGALLAVRS